MMMRRIVKTMTAVMAASMLMLSASTVAMARDPKISPTHDDVPPVTADNTMNPMIPIGTGVVLFGLGGLVIYSGKKRI